MELTREQIDKNWEEYKELLRSTGREYIESLIAYLEEKSDFKVAPASTKYHDSFDGGLCYHSLKVYKYLNGIVSNLVEHTYDADTIKIVALLHDISKVNNYEKVAMNKKVYSPNGSKMDEMGRFDWVATTGFKTRDPENKFIYSNHEGNSEFIIRQFISLHIEESVAILHHHGGLGYDSLTTDILNDIYDRYPLAMYLHFADMMAVYGN